MNMNHIMKWLSCCQHSWVALIFMHHKSSVNLSSWCS